FIPAVSQAIEKLNRAHPPVVAKSPMHLAMEKWRTRAPNISGLGEGFGDGFCPAVLGFEDEFDYFAGGSVASGGVGGVVAGGFEFGGGVGYGYGESGALGEGDVGEVVADPGGFFFGHASFFEALFEGGGFSFLA